MFCEPGFQCGDCGGQCSVSLRFSVLTVEDSVL